MKRLLLIPCSILIGFFLHVNMDKPLIQEPFLTPVEETAALVEHSD
ncbi:hypothetical protein [Alteribacillus sp. YIM 98480]|nr:hypothetical protein [Alteribacillus sp. YIM 98480]